MEASKEERDEIEWMDGGVEGPQCRLGTHVNDDGLLPTEIH
jgi:hypothetical protein